MNYSLKILNKVEELAGDNIKKLVQNFLEELVTKKEVDDLNSSTLNKRKLTAKNKNR